jgi:hypothetical protein
MAGYALTSVNQADVVAANAQIQSNSGIPTPDGKTVRWDIPRKPLTGDNFWFIAMPPAKGWNQYTQEQMMQGVVNVTQTPYQPSWDPQPPA